MITGNKEPEEPEIIYVPAGAESSSYGTNSSSEDDDVQLLELNVAMSDCMYEEYSTIHLEK